ncbi:MAG: SpaA isopeptide-forming pilin-related protein [Defluviitaleaceae bacterium]|nr:SpaA isopeptide-forming pilin-related protein [Defluviitaleaceae bacterium]
MQNSSDDSRSILNKHLSFKRVLVLFAVLFAVSALSIFAYTYNNDYEPTYFDSYIGEVYPYMESEAYDYPYVVDSLDEYTYYNDYYPRYYELYSDDEYSYADYVVNEEDYESDDNQYIEITPFGGLPPNFPFPLTYTLRDTTSGDFDTGLPANRNIYIPDVSPIEVWPGMDINMWEVFSRPRFGYSMIHWRDDNVFITGRAFPTSLRQLNLEPYYVYDLWHMGLLNPMLGPDFVRIEITGNDHTFVHVVGYTPVTELITLEHSSLFSNIHFPSIPWNGVDAGDFPPYPQPDFYPGPGVANDGPNFNAIFEGMTTSDYFNFGIFAQGSYDFSVQPVDIVRNTVAADPRDTDTVDVGVQYGFDRGTYTDVLLVRHGPAEVGRVNLTLRVLSPIPYVVIGPPNRGAGGPSYDGEVNIDLTILQPDPNDPTNTINYYGIPDEDMGYNYVGNPTNDQQKDNSNIIIVIPPPCEYTFFIWPEKGYGLYDIVIAIPPGYEEHSRYMDGDNLVVVLRPLQAEFPFTFIKLDDEDEPLPGAEFRLYRQCTDDPSEWLPVSGQNPQISSNPDGEVHFTLSRYGEYRLREHQAPPGFSTPPGHWNIIRDPVTREINDIVRSNAVAPNFEWRPIVTVSGASSGFIGWAPEAASPLTPNCDCHSYAAAQLANGYYHGGYPNYVPIMPLGPEVEHAVITHPDQLAAEISSIPANGEPHIIRFNFPGNLVVTTGSDVPTIDVPPGNRNIILDSYNGSNQVWNRNQASGRHIIVGNNTTLELRDVTLGRDADWATVNTFASGGITGNAGSVVRMTHPRATLANNRAASGGGINLSHSATFYMSAGNIINNVSSSTVGNAGGGGIFADGFSQSLTINLSGGRISGNRALGFGGGIGLCCTVTINMSGNARIYDNTSVIGGGGINTGSFDPANHINLNGGSIHSNHTDARGGGIRRGTNSTNITINGGTITRNTAAFYGGGLYLLSSAGNFVMNGGSITRNQASSGGGIFITHNNNQLIQNFTINAGAVFGQNVASEGMRVNHDMATLNPQVQPNIVTVYQTGHAFTNHDINSNGDEYGWHVENELRPPDWIRLNYAINIMNPAPTYIVIHEADSGVTEGPGPSGSGIFNLVVSDDNPILAYEGRVITTVPILLPAPAPASDPHRISVTRPVTVRAADGSNIILRMPVPNSANTPNNEPWGTTLTNLNRHFIIGTGGNLILDAEGNGTLRIDGNMAANAAGNRGGVHVGSGILTMQSGTGIFNSRATNGGGVSISGTNSTFNMFGGVIGHTNPIYGNTAQFGGGVHISTGSTFNMYVGDVTGNTARNGGNGGGVWVSTSASFSTRGNLALTGYATIINNEARGDTVVNGNGGGVFVSAGANVTLGNGTRISSNRAISAESGHNTGNGGGIYTLASLTIGNGVIIRYNMAMRYSPGEDSGMGGGVYVRGGNTTNSVVLTMTGGEIYGNRAERFGGGVAITSGANNVYRGAVFNMSGGLIHDNEADRPENRPAIGGMQGGMPSGGGVSLSRGGGVTGGAAFNMSGGIISGNRARSHGSGVDVFNSGPVDNQNQRLFFSMSSGAVIQYNEPFVVNQVYGGGVSVRSNSLFTMNGGTIRANRANWGSALNIQGNGHFHLVNGVIGGTTFADGNYDGNAAIFINSGRLVMEGGQIIGNRGSVAGGIFNSAATTAAVPTNGIFMSGGVIAGNTAGIAPGGGPSTAAFNGGGGVRNLGRFIMSEDAVIRNNTAIVNGGGVWTNGSGGLNGFWMSDNAAIYGNIAEGGGGIPTNVAPVRGGGGVYVAGRTVDGNVVGGRFEMSGGTIGGATAAHANHALTNDPTESSGGGGVALSAEAVFAMSGGRIEGNVSDQYGGGVWVGYDSSFTLSGTTAKHITGNEAEYSGGGVWVAEDSEMLMQPLSENLHITNNVAGHMGGGIYTEAAEYGTPLTRLTGADRAYHNLHLRNVTFSGNRAGRREFPPSNALDVTPRPVDDWISLSVDIHPFNNYDINFIGGIELPRTGGLGIGMFTMVGIAILGGAVGMLIFVKRRRNKIPLVYKRPILE